MSATTIYYHADCLDGFGAAYSAWRHFGENATYLPMHHGEPWRAADVANREVFILDFSFPRETLEAMACEAIRVTQIDHHATACKPWRGLLDNDPDERLSKYVQANGKLTLIFNLTKSGCHLAWEYFHPSTPLPRGLMHIADVDMWRFAHPDSSPFCRALRLQPFDFKAWDALISLPADHPDFARLIQDGRAIETFFLTEVQRLASSHLVQELSLPGEAIDRSEAQQLGIATIELDGRHYRAVKGLSVNANGLFASELGNQLALQSHSFGMTWVLAADSEVKVSLRACNQIDVSTVAEHYGGGGHPNASGFRLSLERFKSEILSTCPTQPGNLHDHEPG